MSAAEKDVTVFLGTVECIQLVSREFKLLYQGIGRTLVGFNHVAPPDATLTELPKMQRPSRALQTWAESG